MTLHEYAMKILSDAGCDEYTYGGEWSTHIMKDLKEAFPNGMEYPYIDVANEILAMSHPSPIKRSKYKTVFWTSDCCDGIDCDDFEEAKSQLWNTYSFWMAEARYNWESNVPTEKEKEDWDYMIYNCGCWIEKYSPMVDEYRVCYELSGIELNEMGWKLFEDEEEGLKDVI